MDDNLSADLVLFVSIDDNLPADLVPCVLMDDNLSAHVVLCISNLWMTTCRLMWFSAYQING